MDGDRFARVLAVNKRVAPFRVVENYIDDTGFIAWRLGTGENVELLHIRTEEKGKGHGRRLVYRMLDRLKAKPPYYSVYGFTRVDNAEAQAFYGALGFSLQEIQGVYADGRAVLFWAAFTELLVKKEEWEAAR